MLVEISETPDVGEDAMRRPVRDEKRWRDAAARRKLEAMRELKILRKNITDVWDEADKRH
jgi:hypothetical protein